MPPKRQRKDFFVELSAAAARAGVKDVAPPLQRAVVTKQPTLAPQTTTRRIRALSIDVGVRKPGVAVVDVWWDQHHARPRCHVGVVCADSAVPDSCHNVKKLGIQRNIKLILKYFEDRAHMFMNPKLDYILIEQQPARGSRLMGHLAYCLWTNLPYIFLKHNPDRADKPPRCELISSKLKTRHFDKADASTRPQRKRIVYKDMQAYLPLQGADMAAVAARIRAHDAKFDMSDAIAQAVAWFEKHVKRPKDAPFLGEAEIIDIISSSSDEGSGYDTDTPAHPPPPTVPFTFNAMGDVIL